MAWLSKDVVLNEEAFRTASEEMEKLKIRTVNLKIKLDKLYRGMANALQSEAGDELQLTANSVILEPIENLSLVINQMSKTLDTIIGTGYYKDIFVGFRELNNK